MLAGLQRFTGLRDECWGRRGKVGKILADTFLCLKNYTFVYPDVRRPRCGDVYLQVCLYFALSLSR